MSMLHLITWGVALLVAPVFSAVAVEAGHQNYAIAMLQATTSPLNRQFATLVTRKDYAGLQKLLKETKNINETDLKGVAPVHYAASMGSVEAMKLLIARRVDLKAKTFGGWTPLHYAAHGGHGEMVQLLVREGHPVNIRDSGGETALFYAVEGNQVQAVRLLMANGADVNADNNQGEMPLSVARKNNFKEIADMLQQAGAQEGEALDPDKRAPD
ncbi:MAG: ankyrin repeat domain-containing protein [Rhodoferax sp.]|nr:ankyrin repeat domain-containing protein [Rhodoferax sp.]